MAGILSGFGFSSKKQPKKDEYADAPNDASASTQPLNSALDGDLSQGSNDQSTNDRNSSMRLSKNAPSKPTDNEFEIPNEPIVPSYNSNIITNKSTSTQGRTPGAVIGPKITLKGELTGEEDLLIQGTVEGTIELKGNQLIIGEQGKVRANLVAKVIIIEGFVEGDLIAHERIEVKASSNVKGNLTSDRVTLEDGAQFRGSIDMETKGPGASGKQAVASTGTTSTSANTSNGNGSSSSKADKA